MLENYVVSEVICHRFEDDVAAVSFFFFSLLVKIIKHVQYIEIDAMRCEVYSSKCGVDLFLQNEIRMDFDRCID